MKCHAFRTISILANHCRIVSCRRYFASELCSTLGVFITHCTAIALNRGIGHLSHSLSHNQAVAIKYLYLRLFYPHTTESIAHTSLHEYALCHDVDLAQED